MQIKLSNYIDSQALAAPEDGQDPRLVCKFVCITEGERLHFVLGPVAEFPYHAALVGQFADDHNIRRSHDEREDQEELLDSSWHIRGGGWLGIDRRTLEMEFAGSSTAYGRFAPEDVEMVISTHSFFTPFEIRFRSYD